MANPDLSAFETELAGASTALNAFAQGPARRAADEIGASFDRAGERIARAMARAALSGEISFKRLAQVVLEELARIALAQVFGKSGDLSLPGGDKSGVSGISSAVNVHFHLSGGADANAIARHQGQIAATVARAVGYGRRNL